jgi:hypothetical protein
MRLQHIALYQPDDALAFRIPGGVEALSGFLEELEARMADHYVGQIETSRALVVAITPKAHAFWLLGAEGTAADQEQVRKVLETVPRPLVSGPIAVALICNLGKAFPAGGGPPVPPEWFEIVRLAGKSLQVDEIVSSLLG